MPRGPCTSTPSRRSRSRSLGASVVLPPAVRGESKQTPPANKHTYGQGEEEFLFAVTVGNVQRRSNINIGDIISHHNDHFFLNNVRKSIFKIHFCKSC